MHEVNRSQMYGLKKHCTQSAGERSFTVYTITGMKSSFFLLFTLFPDTESCLKAHARNVDIIAEMRYSYI